MKKILTLVIPVCLVSFTALAQVEKGSVGLIEDGEEVEIRNLEPTKTAGKVYAYGDKCNRAYNSTVTLIGEDATTHRVLVRYDGSNAINRYSACPNGVIFFMKEQDFLKAKKRFDEKTESDRQRERDRGVVEKILKGN